MNKNFKRQNQVFEKKTKTVFFSGIKEEEEVIWGFHSVFMALCHSLSRVKKIYVTSRSLEKFSQKTQFFSEKDKFFSIEVVSSAELTKMLGEEAVHQGSLAVLQKKSECSLKHVLQHNLLVLLDQVTDPHNVGAILRSCAAFSVGALITTERHSPQNSSVISKIASGGGEFVPHVKVVNLSRTIEHLQKEGFFVIGLESTADLSLERQMNALKKNGKNLKIAIILGAEGKGLRELTLKKCDFLCSLSLPGTIKSLNVSNAAALALYVVTKDEC